MAAARAACRAGVRRARRCTRRGWARASARRGEAMQLGRAAARGPRSADREPARRACARPTRAPARAARPTGSRLAPRAGGASGRAARRRGSPAAGLDCDRSPRGAAPRVGARLRDDASRRRQRAAHSLPSPTRVWLEQVHGASVVPSGDPRQRRRCAAAPMPRSRATPDVVLAVRAADCLPGAVRRARWHAPSASRTPAGAGSPRACSRTPSPRWSVPPSTIVAWLGPAIGPSGVRGRSRRARRVRRGRCRTPRAHSAPVAHGKWLADLERSRAGGCARGVDRHRRRAVPVHGVRPGALLLVSPRSVARGRMARVALADGMTAHDRHLLAPSSIAARRRRRARDRWPPAADARRCSATLDSAARVLRRRRAARRGVPRAPAARAGNRPAPSASW